MGANNINKFKNKPNKIYHLPNGGHVWHSRSCVVACHVHIKVDGVIYALIGKRGLGKNKGKYNVPCGYLDWSENLEESMFREAWEETGLYLPDYKEKFIKSWTIQPWYLSTSPRQELQNIVFQCGVYMELDHLPELSLDNMEPDECETAEWVSLPEIFKTLGNTAFCYEHFDRTFEFNKLYSDAILLDIAQQHGTL